MPAVLLDEQQHLQLRPLREGRPPAQTWAGTPAGRSRQPTLLFGTDPPSTSPPRPQGHRVHVVSEGGDGSPPAGLPDAAGWSSSLAVAFAEALQGQRAVGQLTRWVDEQVLATLQVSTRSHSPAAGGRARTTVAPVRLRSVHVQFPTPTVVEVSAHVQVDRRSRAFAFRLEAWYDRWLCTALELAPREPSRSAGQVTA